MSIFENPSFYVSIFTSVCFVASEILPFIPNTGNGIVHSILECLSSYNKSNPADHKLKEKEDPTNIPTMTLTDVNKKLDEVLSRLNIV